MGLFFAPMARLTLGFAPSQMEGVASGTSNALRQLGTVLGIAVLGAVFSSYGGYASPAQFVAGASVAQWVGGAVLIAGVLLALAIPKSEATVAATASAVPAGHADEPVEDAEPVELAGAVKVA